MKVAARLAVIVVFSITTALAQDNTPDAELFPRPQALEGAVNFWTRVYTEVDTNSGFIHDDERLSVVYDTLRFPTDISSRQRRRQSRAAIARFRDILNDLADGGEAAMTTEVARVRALWPADTTRDEFRAAAGRLRFQLGQANRYRAGLVRSGRWRPYILEVLRANGLPEALSALPHVESSFDPTAYSKVGAAGMWQFTRSTGLRYMQIDHIVDQRRDPFMATDAAVRLLADNFSVIESWPLALTAYNHGLAGMRRAASQLGTKDMGTIVQQYKGRTFGFASRNFYAAFLAALHVERNAERYFGPVEKDRPEAHEIIDVPDFVDAKPLAQALDLEVAELQRLNPALMETVWAGEKFVPRGFKLRLPAARGNDAVARIRALPGSQLFAEQRPDLQHRVRSGDTLSGIASRYGISLAALVRANGLSNRHFIRAGQTLNLPVQGGAAPTPAAAIAELAAGEYTVRSGDSIDRIAQRLNIAPAALLQVNRLANRNRIYPGQVLKVPGAENQPQTQAATALTARPTPPAEQPATSAADPAPRVSQPTASVAKIAADLPAQPQPDDAAAELAALATEEPQPSALESSQAVLAGDPSDYSVAADGSIEVQAMETLGHYADWLGIRTQRLRDLNGMPFGKAVVYGQRIRLDFSSIDSPTFERRRQAFQESRQESFFSNYRIDQVIDHVVRSGESLWVLASRRYEVPVWLIRQYNPDLDLDRISPGTVVKFPRLQSILRDAANVEVG